jgi:predicted transcriptional regulator YdeE
MELVERARFRLCGYFVETTLAKNDADVSALCADFFRNGRDAVPADVTVDLKGYYGLMWYTLGNEKYIYLLGREVGAAKPVPKGAVAKEIPAATFAVARYPQGESVVKAWNTFFYHDIPDAGFQVNHAFNLFFEYYPGNVGGAFELWAPVTKAAV